MCEAQLKKYCKFTDKIDDGNLRADLQKLLGQKDMHITCLEIENSCLKNMVNKIMTTCKKKYKRVL